MSEGMKFDNDKPMFNLLIPEFVEEVAKVMTLGAQKYAPNNWQKVDNAEDRYIAALYRHLNAYHKGEKIDQESGLSHLAHITCNAMFLYWFDINNKE